MAAAAAAANATTTTTTTAAATGKLADSTDASSERYSPSSSCNNADDFSAGVLDAPSRTFINNNNENDCDMPTDLSMSNASGGPCIKTEKMSTS